MPNLWRQKGFLLSLAAAALVAGGIAWSISRPPDPRKLAERVQDEVAAIRELPFKHPVPVKRVSREEWRAHVDQAMRKAPKLEHYWDTMRMVGIYRGPDLGSWEEAFASLHGSAGGSYDARTDTFMLMADVPRNQRGVVFAHELHHGLQDQHFDLVRYLLDVAQDPNANGDLVLARQSVVEGEAAFIDTLYQAKHAPGARSTRAHMAAMTAETANWDAERWGRIPPFSFELATSPYIDGQAFIEAVQKRGWPEVNKLYGEYPPVSTEQILHPDKWFAREEPLRIAWPAFDGAPLFADWELQIESVLGERQWRIVFRTQDLAREAPSAAAGWNGDRFAVFRNAKTGAMLMLVCTSWDTPEDATEFADTYARLLVTKHPGNSVPTRLKKAGNTVRIVEGATPETIDAFMAFNDRAGW